MAFDLPRSPRQLRFTGGVRAVEREPAASSPWDGAPKRPDVPPTVPLARPRAKLGPPPPKPWEPDEEDVPTTIHHAAIAASPPPAFTPPPPAAGRPAQPRAVRPIPNFRPAPSPVGAAGPAGAPGPLVRGRSGPTRTRPSRRKRAMRSLPLVAWVLLAVVCGSISFFVAPPIVDRLGAVAFHKAAPPAR